MAIDLPDYVSKAVSLACSFQDNFKPGDPVFPLAELRTVAETGLHKIALPRQLGGDGIGVAAGQRGTLLAILKEIGRGNLVLGRVFEGHVNALLLLQQFGSEGLMQEVAADVLERRHVFGVWNTGPPASPQLIKLPNGNFRMSGSKTFATGALRIQRAIVTAELPDGGWQMCLVPLNHASLKVDRSSWRPLGMQASESFTVEFLDVELAPHLLVGRPGDYYAEPTFTSGALRFSSVQLGGAEALFENCCDFVRQSERQNDPSHLQRIGQMAVLIESGRQWLERGAQWLEESFETPATLAVHAQTMRLAVEEICTRMIQLVEQTVGARGLTGTSPFAALVGDLQMYLRQAGYDQAFQSVGREALRARAR